MTDIKFIENQIKTGDLWNGKILTIRKKYIVIKKIFDFQVGTTFVFYGFGHQRFDSATVLCIHQDGDANPRFFFFPDTIGFSAEFEASVQSVNETK